MFGGTVLVGRELLALRSLLCCHCLVCDPHCNRGNRAPVFPLASAAEPAGRKSIHLRYAVSRDARNLGPIFAQVAISGNERALLHPA
jgi:hypothetical protein